jgi:hypothetical protein
MILLPKFIETKRWLGCAPQLSLQGRKQKRKPAGAAKMQGLNLLTRSKPETLTQKI